MARRINALVIDFESKEELYRIIAKIAVNSLLLSNSIRRDTLLNVIVLKTNEVIMLDGSKVRNLRPDEESSIGLIRSLFRKRLTRKIRDSENLMLKEPCIEYYYEGVLLKQELNKLCNSSGFTIVYPENSELMQKYCKYTVKIPYITSFVEAVVIGGLMLDWCCWRRCFRESL